MMQPAVGHEETMAPRDLAFDDATNINAGLAHKESTQLQDDLRPGQARVQTLEDGRQVPADERDIEALVAGKVWNTEAAADVEDAHRTRCVLREALGELDALPLRLRNRVGAEVLRAAKDVESLELELKLADSVQHGGHALGVDAERLGPATHLHPGTLQLE